MLILLFVHQFCIWAHTRIASGSAFFRRRLEETARSLKKRKNWIIIEAREDYLQKKHRAALAAEARRQSILVRAAEHEDHEFWEVGRYQRVAMKHGDLVVAVAPGDLDKPRPALIVQSDL